MEGMLRVCETLGSLGKSPAACMLETHVFERLCLMKTVEYRRLGPVKKGKRNLSGEFGYCRSPSVKTLNPNLFSLVRLPM